MLNHRTIVVCPITGRISLLTCLHTEKSLLQVLWKLLSVNPCSILNSLILPGTTYGCCLPCAGPHTHNATCLHNSWVSGAGSTSDVHWSNVKSRMWSSPNVGGRFIFRCRGWGEWGVGEASQNGAIFRLALYRIANVTYKRVHSAKKYKRSSTGRGFYPPSNRAHSPPPKIAPTKKQAIP